MGVPHKREKNIYGKAEPPHDRTIPDSIPLYAEVIRSNAGE